MEELVGDLCVPWSLQHPLSVRRVSPKGACARDQFQFEIWVFGCRAERFWYHVDGDLQVI